MNTSIPKNPYISIQEESAAIAVNKKHYRLKIRNIQKIYITKWKSGYLPALIGQLLFIPNTRYNLHIDTTDGQKINLRINTLQRFYFIRLISNVRLYQQRNFGKLQKSA